ncbi:MAG: O-antigen ligase family protein [Clostridia bacterium]|nr:O-antigen ligase family protein [Clostridia bacterium]
MMRIKKKFGIYDIETVLFVLTVVFNSVFGSTTEMLFLSKIPMLTFFLVELVIISLEKRFTVDRLMIFPLLFFVLEAVSLFWSYNYSVSYAQFITQIQLFCLFVFVFLYIKRIDNINIYLISIYVSGLALMVYSLTVYGVGQYFSLLMSGARLGGEIANENTYGMAFSQAAVVAFYYFLENKKIFHIPAIFALTVFAFSSGSKKAAIMIPLGLLFIVFIKYGIKKAWMGLLILTLSFIILYNMIQLPVFSTVLKRLTLFATGESYSDNVRKEFITIGLDLYHKNPFGLGLQSFAYVTRINSYSHNNMVELLVSLGFIGLVLFYVPFARYIWWSFFRIKYKDPVSNVLLVLVLISMIMGYGMVQFYGKGIWILMGVMMAHYQNEKEKARAE